MSLVIAGLIFTIYITVVISVIRSSGINHFTTDIGLSKLLLMFNGLKHLISLYIY